MIGLLPGGESNPGLPRDRRGYSPLYYRGHLSMKIEIQGCVRLGNLDFDFKIRISDFLIKAGYKNGFRRAEIHFN